MKNHLASKRRPAAARTFHVVRTGGVQIGWLVSTFVVILLIGLLFYRPTTQESALRIVNQDLDLGEVHVGDVVKFDLLVENISTKPCPIAVDAGCDCIATGDDDWMLQPTEMLSIPMSWRIGPEPLGTKAYSPLRKIVDVSDQLSGRNLSATVQATLVQPVKLPQDGAFKFDFIDRLADVKNRVHKFSAIVPCVPGTESMSVELDLDGFQGAVDFNSDPSKATLTFHVNKDLPLGKTSTTGTLHWNGEPELGAVGSKLEIPLTLSVLISPPFVISPAVVSLVPGQDEYLTVSAIDPSLSAKFVPDGISVPPQVVTVHDPV